MPVVILQRRTKHQNIIKINNNKCTQESAQDMVHEAHEGGRSVGEAKWHDKPFIESILRLECRLPHVTFGHPDLVVTAPEINFGEDGGAVELIQHVIKARVTVFDGDLVDGSTINTHPP